MFNKIKIGKYYVLDESCELGLKEHQPVKVKVIKKLRHGNYIVMPIEPVVYPIMDNGWAIKNITVHKRYLSPTTIDERIVIRCPINMPRFSRTDEMVLNSMYDTLINHGTITQTDILRLKAILYKIRYALSFNDINIWGIIYGK